MQKWTFEIEVTTPLFLSGANSKNAEFRPPSIKNLMRFWYRACFDKEFLTKSLENQIYGSTENQGKFKPIIKNSRNLDITEYTKEYDRSQFQNYSGIQYFSFPFALGKNRRNYIGPQTTPISEPLVFSLQLKYFGNSKKEKKAILASLWLLIWLGGVGSRNRKGFGSLSFINEPNEDTFGLKFCFDGDISNFNDFLQTNLIVAIKWINPNFSRQNSLPKHTSLVSHQSQIYLLTRNFEENKDLTTWKDAIDYAGVLIQQYRHINRLPDYQTVAKVILLGEIDRGELLKPAWGLPIKYQYRSLFRDYFIEEVKKILQRQQKYTPNDRVLRNIAKDAQSGRDRKDSAKRESKRLGVPPNEFDRIVDESTENSAANVNIGFQATGNTRASEKVLDRRSSPLFIKIAKLADKKFGVLFLFLPAQLLPDDKNFRIKISASNNNSNFVDPPDFGMIEDFLRKKVILNAEKISF